MTMFSGALTAMVTPFRAGAVDDQALRALVSAQVAGGIHGLVPVGTTGESPNLSDAEYEQVVRTVVEESNGRVPVLVGAGSASTAHAVALARTAQGLGADGVLCVAPYYNRPGVRGMIAHFRAIADAVDLPLVLYNVPYRTGSDLDLAVLEGLADHPRVVGIKEASNTVQRTIEILDRFGDRFFVLSGDDVLALPIMAVGGQGVISVVSNIVPERVVAMVAAMQRQDLPAAREQHRALVPLMRAAFMESSPAPTKAALAMLGRIAPDARLPVTAMSEAGENQMRRVLAGLGML